RATTSVKVPPRSIAKVQLRSTPLLKQKPGVGSIATDLFASRDNAPYQLAMAVLVTGVAGFIGAATAHALMERGDEVVGIDNLNGYYDPRLKQARLDKLHDEHGNRFRFERIDFADAEALQRVADSMEIETIVHLGAQAGVRYSF